MSEPVRGWAIKGPDGTLYWGAVGPDEPRAWARFCKPTQSTKDEWTASGYRAVQVEIREVENGM